MITNELSPSDPVSLFQEIISIVGAGGTILTVIGLAIAIIQLRRTKNSIAAATEASRSANEDSKSKYFEYIISNTRLLMRDLESATDDRNWARGALRATDLADHFAQIVRVVSYTQNSDAKIISDMRDWSRTFQRLEREELRWEDSLEKKWSYQIRRCYAIVDSNFGPFKTGGADDV
jgi:hypothetical protein